MLAASKLGHAMYTIVAASQKGGSGKTTISGHLAVEAARSLYEDLGFHEIPPYYHNPIAGAHYLKCDLDSGFTPLVLGRAVSLRR